MPGTLASAASSSIAAAGSSAGSGFAPCLGVPIVGATSVVFMNVARRTELELRADGGPDGGCGWSGWLGGSRADMLPVGGRFSWLFDCGRSLADMLPDGRLAAIFSLVDDAMDDAEGDRCGLTAPGGGRPCREGDREGGRCCLEGDCEGGREERDGDWAALGRSSARCGGALTDPGGSRAFTAGTPSAVASATSPGVRAGRPPIAGVLILRRIGLFSSTSADASTDCWNVTPNDPNAAAILAASAAAFAAAPAAPAALVAFASRVLA